MATDIINNETAVNTSTITDPAFKIIQTGSGVPLRIEDSLNEGKVITVKSSTNTASSLQILGQTAQIAESTAEENDIMSYLRNPTGTAIYNAWKRFDHVTGNENFKISIPVSPYPIPTYTRATGSTLIEVTYDNSVHASYSKLSSIPTPFIIEFIPLLGPGTAGEFLVLSNVNIGGSQSRLTFDSRVSGAIDGDCQIKYRESSAWTYDNTTNELKSLLNTSGYCGFYSDGTYENYILDVIVRSTDADNDRLAIVCAAVRDSNGKLHTLSFGKDQQGVLKLGLIYNWFVSTNVLLDRSANTVWQSGNWSAYSGGIRMFVERKDNIFSFTVTKPSATLNYWLGRTWTQIGAAGEIDDAFSFDIDSNPAAAAIFNQPCSFGFAAQSQKDAFFNVLNFTNTETIYNISTYKKRYNRNSSTGVWQGPTTFSPKTEFGAGKFVVDPYKGSTFYVDPSTDTMLKISHDPLFAKEDVRVSAAVKVGSGKGLIQEEIGGAKSFINVDNGGNIIIT